MTLLKGPKEQPKRVDYRRAAELVSQRYFPISHRTIERWPLPRIKVNGRNTFDTAEVIAFAEALLKQAEAKQKQFQETGPSILAVEDAVVEAVRGACPPARTGEGEGSE
jgi:hypothetical protein